MAIWKMGRGYLAVCMPLPCLPCFSETASRRTVKVTNSSVNSLSLLTHTLMIPATYYSKLLPYPQVVSVE